MPTPPSFPMEMERKAEFKSEYFRGMMHVMAGTSEVHAAVIHNLHGLLYSQLRGRPSRVYSGVLRVRVAEQYVSPDLSLVHEAPKDADRNCDALMNPTVVCEVMTPLNEGYDRSQKFHLYQSIESLQECLLVSTDRVSATLFTRRAHGNWLVSFADRVDDALELTSIDCRLKLADLYDKIEVTHVQVGWIRPVHQ